MSASLALPVSLRLRVDGNTRLSSYKYRYPDIMETIGLAHDNFDRGDGYKIGLQRQVGNAALGIVNYTWGKTRQYFQGRRFDQISELGEFSFQARIRFSARDSLSAETVFGVTSYFNKFSSNTIHDRDQKTIVFNGRLRHDFSRFFTGGISGGVNSIHQIYSSGLQSANNVRNDTYILTPFALWHPAARLNCIQSFEIQANYITYDFDRKKIATRNRIFRRATSKSELELVVSRRLIWKQAYSYRYEDYGQLIWDESWQQAVSWDRRKNGLETKFVYQPNSIVQITPSFAWEKSGDFSHGVESDSSTLELREIRYLSDEQVKMLFGVEFLFSWDQARHFKAEFSRRVRKFMTRPRESYDIAIVSMEYMF
jgi:hypothetical protein